MQNENYSKELNRLIDYIERKVVTQYPTMKINLNYLMLAILEQCDSFIYTIFKQNMMDSKLDVLYNMFSQLVEQKALKAVKPNRVIKYDDSFEKALKSADTERKEFNGEKITSVHVILAILKDDNEDNKIREILQRAGMTYESLKRYITTDIEDIESDNDVSSPKKLSKELAGVFSNEGSMPYSSQSGAAVREFCSDISKLAENYKIDKVIGRTKELNSLVRVLSRKKKNNVILVGEGGCGKTIIAENVAYLIDNGDVPPFMRNKRVISLDYTALISGTQYRGMLEERTRNLINEIKRNKNYILLIDDIDRIFGSHGGSEEFGISAMLSRAMEDGSIQIVGTCGFKGYRNVFEKDSSLERRFQKIVITPTTHDEAILILNGIKPTYEEYHKVKFEDGVVEAAVNLAEKYNTERTLPDSAIDLIDEAAASESIKVPDRKWGETKKKLRQVIRKIEELKAQDNYDEADKLSNEESSLRVQLSKIEKEYDCAKEYATVTIDDIIATTSIRTGIPINKLTVDEKQKLKSMSERIKSEVIGQDEAIDKICNAIKRNRVGIRNDRNYGTFLLIGRSGVGKTLIAKKLAKEVFGDETNLIRFDMSEFSDKTSINKLIGSNPGYVGYDEGGRLTESIKNKKHCVLLLDEIEKADKEVYNLFLQVFDEGFLTDNSGRKIDFKNTIIIMTSNVGVRTASEFGRSIGFSKDDDDNSEKILLKELKKTFPPEFINRIDDIIYLNNLSDADLKNIISIELRKMRLRCLNAGVDIVWEEDSVDYILNSISNEKEMGARPIIRAIQNEYEDKIADLLLDDNFEKSENGDFKVYNLNIIDGKPRIID